MKNLVESYFSHKELYLASAGVGATVAGIMKAISENTPSEILGISITIWILAFIINVYDIHTGIKADTVRKRNAGGNFVFESRKGWRAIEKIFIFTVVIGFLHYFENELNRYEMPHYFAFSLLVIKLGMFFYIVLVELQSIGENNEVRYGKKDKLFVLLDRIISTVNDGIINSIKGFFNKDTNKNEE